MIFGLTNNQLLIGFTGVVIALLVGLIEIAGHMPDGQTKIFLLVVTPLLLDQFRRWKEGLKRSVESNAVSDEKIKRYKTEIAVLKKQRDLLGDKIKALRSDNEQGKKK